VRDTRMTVSEINDFERDLSARLSAWIGEASNYKCREDLFITLGCSHLYRTNQSWVFDPGEMCDIAVEQLVAKTLLSMLEASLKKERFADESIFGGLLQRGRWRQCLARADTAYAFAAMLVTIYGIGDEMYSEGGLVQLSFLKKLAEPVFDEWLHIKALGDRPFETITRAMFGDAWYSLVISDNVEPATIAEIIKAIQPPFLPGLTPALEQATQPLPDIGSLA
jgi:hypothetical protein